MRIQSHSLISDDENFVKALKSVDENPICLTQGEERYKAYFYNNNFQKFLKVRKFAFKKHLGCASHPDV
ncbi:hypothetical protein NPIL_388571 [Nephila pilipes]|uniref:Uncharacterized protein n=1 Tax=Nephila pilipes TaxID=299642 RepID=A0A8X6QGI1_NEPPI|nr:hypothetical protein NPIL_388571 [Nephila pilipes]